jgi:hypothetical protein
MLLLNLAASGFMYFFSIWVLGDIFSGYNCSVAVDYLVSALLLCLAEWRIA